MISWLILATAIASFAFSMWHSLLMLAHLRGGNRELLKTIMLGPLSGREAFTEQGWRHRNRAVGAAFAALVSFAAWAVVFMHRG